MIIFRIGIYYSAFMQEAPLNSSASDIELRRILIIVRKYTIFILKSVTTFLTKCGVPRTLLFIDIGKLFPSECCNYIDR